MSLPNKKISQFPLTTSEELQNNSTLKVDVLLNGANKTMPVSQFGDAGILTKEVYDTDNDGRVDEAAHAENAQFSQTAANADYANQAAYSNEASYSQSAGYADTAAYAASSSQTQDGYPLIAIDGNNVLKISDGTNLSPILNTQTDNTHLGGLLAFDDMSGELIKFQGSSLDVSHASTADKADSATKATNDENGNNIVDTYATQTALSGKQDVLGYTPEDASKKGANNGYAPLNNLGKIDTTYIPDSVLGQLHYMGTYNAASGSFPMGSSKGDYYIANSNGTGALSTYLIGDWLVYNGTTWDKVDNTDAVASVNGKMGTVVLTTADVADSTDKRYVTQAEKTILSNTSNTNTGDETASTIRTKIGNASTVGNTGGYLTKADYDTFNAKQAALGYTAENQANKSTSVTTDGASDTKYPSVKAVKTYVDSNPSFVNGFQPSSQQNPDLKSATGVEYVSANLQYHAITHNSNLEVTDCKFSVEWFGYLNTSSGFEPYIYKRKSSDLSGLFFGKSDANYILMRLRNVDSTNDMFYASSTPLTAGWYHIVVTVDGVDSTNARMYINGRQVATGGGTNTLTVYPQNTNDMNIGGGALNTYYSNSITSIARYYNYALTVSDVSNLWNGGKPVEYRLPFALLNASNTNQVLTNSDFSLGTGNNFTDWNKIENSPSTITENLTGGTSGSRAISFNGSAANDYIGIKHNTGVFVKGKQYRYSVYAYTTSGIGTLIIGDANTNAVVSITSTTPTTYTGTFIAGANEPINIKRGSIVSTSVIIDSYVITQVGATLSLEAKNAYSDKWISNSNLYIATPVHSPNILVADDYKALSRLEDYNITTTNSTGQTKTFTLPAGYFVRDIQVGNKGASNMTNVYCTVGGINILNAKTVAASKMGRFTLIGDMTIDTAATQSVVVGWDTTHTSGCSIVINIERAN